MSKDQFGIWTNVFDYTAYFVLFSGLLPFWVTRFAARGQKGTVKTGVLAQLLIGVIAVAVYFPVIVLISRAIGTEAYLPIYFIAGLYALTYYMITIFESVLQSVRPQAVGYGLMIEEIVKVTIALVLILGFKQLFLGAIVALTASCVVQILYYGHLLSDELKEKVNWGYLKEWLKGSTAFVYSAIGGQLVAFVFILLFVYGGADTRAYYQAAFTFTTIIGYSSSLATALYPKLLANSCSDKQVGESFRTVLMFAIPFAAITMVMSISFLTVLRADYSVAWPVLIALTVDTLVTLIYGFYTSCLMGKEAFDAEGKISIRKLVKSKIFTVFTIPYIQAAIAVPLAYFVLTRLPVAGSVQAVLYIVAILIGVHLSTFLGLYIFMHPSTRIPIAWKSISKYIIASIIMSSIMLLLIPPTTTLLPTIAKSIIGFAIYVGLMLAIDAQARKLVGLIWLEIKVSFKQLTSKNNNSQEKPV